MSEPCKPNENREGRDGAGRFVTGAKAGPGRPSLPSWFREGGETALRHLLNVAEGKEIDAKVSRAQACVVVVERIYGTAPKAPEDQDAAGQALAELLSRLRASEG